ncbi:GTPase-activating protein S13 [Arthrobotrys musiformis]|uniref:Protein transport protein SEC13 n=1 Tax=Arthrobotrys musiformis TaxID=47236 RepID=A0AAV9WNH0_9PEZI
MAANSTDHEDMIHDAVLNFYGNRLATCSSDKTIKIFEVEGNNHTFSQTLKGHDGPVWCVAWAHPKYGNIIASASYDAKVIIWLENGTNWTKLIEHTNHTASVNMVSWAPHTLGEILACASTDGKVSVLEFKDGNWDTRIFNAHATGCNAVSWAPDVTPGSIVQSSAALTTGVRKFVTGGSDNYVKIWVYSPEQDNYVVETVLEGHTDWVRDVAWAPSILSRTYIASASQDKSVIIWTSDAGGPFQKKVLQMDAVVWRVSWSLSGNVLAVSGGDNKVTLWKENLQGEWEKVTTVTE